jgi:hypothetical protein
MMRSFLSSDCRTTGDGTRLRRLFGFSGIATPPGGNARPARAGRIAFVHNTFGTPWKGFQIPFAAPGNLW